MLKYIELKTGFSDNGPAWIARVSCSKSGQTIYFDKKAFKKLKRPRFSWEQERWQLKDQLLIEGNPVEFDIQLEDFNFDGTKDIYIQTSISNGYPISLGHLILVDAVAPQLYLVETAADLGNLRPDSLSPTLIAEEVIWCQEDASKTACQLYYYWSADSLVFDHKECPCVPE